MCFMGKNKIFDEKTITAIFRITLLLILAFILVYLISCEAVLANLEEYFIEFRGLG